MGYTTTFKGTLEFTNELTISQLRKLKTFLGEDCRDHPEWGADKNVTYIDLELNDDMSGLEWDGSEKTYYMVESVNLIITQMRKEYPDFGLVGKLEAQGEEVGDHWFLIADGNTAYRQDKVKVHETLEDILDKLERVYFSMDGDEHNAELIKESIDTIKQILNMEGE